MANTPIDIIILSYTKTRKEYDMTTDCINSFKNSINVSPNIILIETNKKVAQFRDVYKVNTLIVPNVEFNYNQFLNFGLLETKNDYILISNNDVIYKPNCLHVLSQKLIEKYDSVSPIDLSTRAELLDMDDIVGYKIGKTLTGWSFMFKKSILTKIGYFDEQFSFWYQDNDYLNWLQKCNLKHALIPTAHITHLYQQSHHLLTAEELYQKTHGSLKLFEEKWKNWDTVQPILNPNKNK